MKINKKYILPVIIQAVLLLIVSIFWKQILSIPFFIAPILALIGSFLYFNNDGLLEGLKFATDHWLQRWMAFGYSICGVDPEKHIQIYQQEYRDLKTFRIPQKEYHIYRAAKVAGIDLLLFVFARAGFEMAVNPAWWKLPLIFIIIAPCYFIYPLRLEQKWDLTAKWSAPFKPSE